MLFEGLQAAVTPLGGEGRVLLRGWLTLNMYTAAGWINVLLGVINAALLSPFFFTERRIAAREAMLLSGATSGILKFNNSFLFPSILQNIFLNSLGISVLILALHHILK